jgi:hypothetical protein
VEHHAALRDLTEVYPWGTIRTPTPDANRATADELDRDEQRRVREGAGPFIDAFDYGAILGR